MMMILRIESVKTFPAWLPETTYLESGEKRTVQASTGPFSIVATWTKMAMIIVSLHRTRILIPIKNAKKPFLRSQCPKEEWQSQES